MSKTIDLEVQNSEHEDFKCWLDNINWEDIENKLFLPLTYQHLFEKKTSPMEKINGTRKV